MTVEENYCLDMSERYIDELKVYGFTGLLTNIEIDGMIFNANVTALTSNVRLLNSTVVFEFA
jgi:hypothetical protein